MQWTVASVGSPLANGRLTLAMSVADQSSEGRGLRPLFHGIRVSQAKCHGRRCLGLEFRWSGRPTVNGQETHPLGLEDSQGQTPRRPARQPYLGLHNQDPTLVWVREASQGQRMDGRLSRRQNPRDFTATHLVSSEQTVSTLLCTPTRPFQGENPVLLRKRSQTSVATVTSTADWLAVFWFPVTILWNHVFVWIIVFVVILCAILCILSDDS